MTSPAGARSGPAARFECWRLRAGGARFGIMPFVSSRRGVRRLALLATAFSCSPAAAQQGVAPSPPEDSVPPGGALDPDSPMAPLPGLGVDWPDLRTGADTPPPLPAAPAPTGKAAAADTRSKGKGATGKGATIDAGAEQHYHYVIEGLAPLGEAGADSVRERFERLSTLKAGAGKPANVAQVDRRARQDEDTLRELLRASGYYDADVLTRVEKRNGAVAVTLEAEPGPPYHFSQVSLPGLAEAGDKEAALRRAFAVKAGDPVDAEKVGAAETALKTQLGREGFAFAKVGAPKVVVDHASHSATLELAVQPDGEKRFGQIRVDGKPLFSARHLSRIARFHPGDRYDSAKIDDFRRALIQTSLVSSVRITPTPGKSPDVVDIDVRLERAPPRTVAGELGYGTGEGIRTELSWTHRNFIKPEGALTLNGILGTQEQLLGVQLRRNNYKARDRVLTAQVSASHTDYAAYDAKTFTVAAGLERQSNIIWQKKWTWSTGTELAISDERDVIASTGQPRRRTYYIAALPGSLAYDGSDDLLNPMRGFRLSGRLSPEVSFRGKAFTYGRAQIDASGYLPITGSTTIAGRVRVGSIFGARADEIAPSRRFYAGGGGSVRGYGYQDIGPRDANNEPVGGQSLAEFSIEGRIRFGRAGRFGIVPFLDGGNIYTTTLPGFTGLRYGAGLGARYYTSFGPIRVDLGTPLNPRQGDSRLAVYVSLGQAF